MPPYNKQTITDLNLYSAALTSYQRMIVYQVSFKEIKKELLNLCLVMQPLPDHAEPHVCWSCWKCRYPPAAL